MSRRDEVRTFKLTMQKGQRDLILEVIAKVKKEYPHVSDARALELVLADWLAGH